MSRAGDDCAWTVPASELEHLTPGRARELVEECFFQAQKETFARAKSAAGERPTEPALREAIATSVRYAFSQVGGDYGRPTRQELEQVVAILARKAAAWGTPADVIEHHRGQLGEILARLAA